MTIRRENPNVFVRALLHAGLEEVPGRDGWKFLIRPDIPGVVIAVPLQQPLDVRKVLSYLRAARITESEYLDCLDRALKDPQD